MMGLCLFILHIITPNLRGSKYDQGYNDEGVYPDPYPYIHSIDKDQNNP